MTGGKGMKGGEVMGRKEICLLLVVPRRRGEVVGNLDPFHRSFVFSDVGSLDRRPRHSDRRQRFVEEPQRACPVLPPSVSTPRRDHLPVVGTSLRNDRLAGLVDANLEHLRQDLVKSAVDGDVPARRREFIFSLLTRRENLHDIGVTARVIHAQVLVQLGPGESDARENLKRDEREAALGKASGQV